MLPELSPVTSSMLKAVGYDATSGTLVVQFHKGQSYQYKDVPQDTYNEMLKSDSVGGFFLNHVKGKFDPTKMADEDKDTETA